MRKASDKKFGDYSRQVGSLPCISLGLLACLSSDNVLKYLGYNRIAVFAVANSSRPKTPMARHSDCGILFGRPTRRHYMATFNLIASLGACTKSCFVPR